MKTEKTNKNYCNMQTNMWYATKNNAIKNAKKGDTIFCSKQSQEYKKYGTVNIYV